MSNKRRTGEEPTIDTMLKDPLVALLMERDGLRPGDVRAVWDAAARRLQEPRRPRTATETVTEAA